MISWGFLFFYLDKTDCYNSCNNDLIPSKAYCKTYCQNSLVQASLSIYKLVKPICR